VDTPLTHRRDSRLAARGEIVLLIGAELYRLSAADARWLDDRIRTTCLDEIGRSHDLDARASLGLAEALREDLEAGQHPEPIELGRSHAVGLTEYVLTAGAAASTTWTPSIRA
jgi:hypothetical protein